MNCLKDYIGIKGAEGFPVPLSGIYINQLPGFTLDKITKIKETENTDLKQLWDEVQDRSWIRLEKKLRIEMRRRFKLKAVKLSAITRQEVDTDVIIEAAEKYRGVVIDFGKPDGSFLSFYIDKIVVPLTVAGDFVVKIFDGDGSTLDTLTVADGAAGRNILAVAKKYLVKKIFIAVDATAVPLYSASFPVETVNKCCDCICIVCETCEPAIYGAESLIETPGVLDETSDAYGLEIGYSVMCDYSSIVCTNKAEFTDVWMYLLGAELMIEAMYSTRMNRYTTIDKERAVELNAYYTVEFEKALEESITALEITEEDCCIECNPQMAQREVLP